MEKKLLYFLVLSLAACAPLQGTPANIPASVKTIQPAETQIPPTSTQEVAKAFDISSSEFKKGEAIPSDFSCDGRDISPALAWTNPPPGTQSFALIMDDPDAPIGIWVHWIIFNMPASTRGLKEAMPTDPQLSDGSLQGKTSAGSSGYHGPCPPSGTHHYFFKLYSLDTMLSLSTDADKKELLAAMEGHILANVALMGTFSH
jgi:Raf kinase inhibitor-like YbhB/YbcL family protein